ncbi:TetR/AcrR family transcriptional regulator [Paracraurococcus lichenis]|uniref:Helix-turn-helix domain-containing protein n=1 Tax=Paracraurococcus lichenis TaxID=3064888 RepID=A0ABT9ECK8_9PROT|nr:TetR/AcrR family transcriptional regulator [Paracraurococcus sp. LOR1-02]MDO9713950.1 helix-turn-helix domain-containing protein [Paracraurococcus sp. LOR1-02]
MRVSKEQAAENRARILAEAARLFRERGLSGVGVDALTEAAGLTHGSLYSQFGSKERLAAAAVEHALTESALSRLPAEGGPAELAAAIGRYLSPRHRDAPGQGCAFAALGCEMPRQGPALRKVFTDGLRERVARFAAMLPGRRHEAPEEQALALLAGMIGALILARAVDDPALSDRILAATAAELQDRLPKA